MGQHALDRAAGDLIGRSARIPLVDLDIPPDVSAKMPLPYWTSDLNEEAIRELADLGKKYGVLTGNPTVAQVYQPVS